MTHTRKKGKSHMTKSCGNHWKVSHMTKGHMIRKAKVKVKIEGKINRVVTRQGMS